VLKGFGLFMFVELLLIPILLGIVFFLTAEKVEPNPLDQQTKLWINLAIILGAFGAILFAYLELTVEQRQQLWGETITPWYIHMGMGVFAWLVSYPVVVALSEGLSLIVWHVFHHPFTEQRAVQNIRQAMDHPILFGLTAFSLITLVPLTEEFLFRALLQTWLRRKLHHPLTAMSLSSLVFTLFHYSSDQGISNIELLTSLFLLSCMLGYLYERQRSLWASVALHSFFNFMTLMMILSTTPP